MSEVGSGQEMFTSVAILLSYFGEERSGGGGGTPDLIHAYVRWGGGVPLDLKMQKFEGSVESIYHIFLLVRLPY